MRRIIVKGLMVLLCVCLIFSIFGCKKQSTQAPVKAEATIYTNGNTGGVTNQPTNPTTFTINESYQVTYIANYHYFNHGVQPGTIALKHQDGTVYGPWQSTGVPGQGDVANASWIVRPNQVIKAGTYTVIDSDPPTWSQNTKSNNQGFTDVRGYTAK